MQMKINKEVNDVSSFCIIALQISYFLSIYRHIPNLFTLSNLAFGLLSISLAFSDHLVLASYSIVLAIVLDFCDGLLARLLNASSEIGKQLDSLADLVSFGVAPSFITLQLFVSFYDDILISDYISSLIKGEHRYIIPFIVFIIPLFSALRLARFNNQQTIGSFAGLPTPANALFYGSLPLIMNYQSDSFISQFLLREEVLTTAVVLFSWMMVSNIEFLAFKFSTFNWDSNKSKYLFLTASFVLLLIFHFVAVPIILLLYFIFSLVNTIKR